MRNSFLVTLFIIVSISLKSQSLNVVYGIDAAIPKEINLPTKIKDSIALITSLKGIVNDLREAAYLTASIDHIIVRKDTAFVNLYLGKTFKWSNLNSGNISDEALSKSNFAEKMFFNKPFSAKETNNLLNELINYYENNGYPFCSIRLINTTIKEDSISAAISITKGPKYLIDSVIVKGTASIGDQYLYNYLGIKPGDIFNYRLINQVSDRLSEIPFIEKTRPYEVQFFQEKSKLILYLDKKTASRFDGIIGLLTNEETGEIEFTGNLELNLLNVIGKGEKFDLKWRKLIGPTQNLDVHFNLPFLLKTPFGLDAKFSLYKRDTLFLDIQHRLGLQYVLKGYDFIQINLARNSSRRLGDGLTTSISSLPPFADYTSIMYGISYYKEKLNYRFNPRKGYQILGETSVGTKKIATISSLLETNRNAYENIPLKSTLFTANVDASLFIPIGSRSTIKVRNQTSAIYNSAIFENELIRIGGIKTLRGFDEESIFANLLSIGTIEYRFILEKNSNLFLFSDIAYYERELDNTLLTDTPFGFGGGINFQTGAGIFSINYAIGKQFNNPIDFRAAKIHFGFISFF